MKTILVNTVVTGLGWLALAAFLYTRERKVHTPSSFTKSATKSILQLIHVITVCAGGAIFALRFEPQAAIAADALWHFVLCSALSFYILDIANMVYDRKPHWRLICHHVMATMVMMYAMVTNTGAWLVAAGCIFAEFPGIFYFSTLVMKRLGLKKPGLQLCTMGLQLFFVPLLRFAGTVGLTLWYLNAVNYEWMQVAIALTCNVYNMYLVHMTITRITPRFKALLEQTQTPQLNTLEIRLANA